MASRSHILSFGRWLPLTTALLLTLALPWVGHGSLAFIALVPIFAYLATTSDSRARSVAWSGAWLLLAMLVTAWPFLHISGAWWAGTHELNRHLSENLQYTFGLVLATVLRLLMFLPLLFFVRPLLSRMIGPFVVALAWVALECAFATYLLFGYGIGVLGYSLSDAPSFAAIGHYVGTFGLSFIIVLFNAALARWISHPAPSLVARVRDGSLGIVLLVALVLLVAAAGRWSPPGDGAKTVRVAAIGTPLSTDESITEAGYRSYRKLLLKALEDRPDLVLFPENALPYFEIDESSGTLVERTLIDFPNRNALYADLVAISERNPNSTLAIGLHTTDAGKHHNSIVYMRGGRIIGYYRKRVPVPLTEYAPFGLRIPLAVSFSRGEESQPFAIDGVGIGALVCSEVADAGLRSPGADVILLSSNDSVFDGGASSVVHLSMARIRAIESGAYVVRANKGGEANVIDPSGAILARAQGGIARFDLSIAARQSP